VRRIVAALCLCSLAAVAAAVQPRVAMAHTCPVTPAPGGATFDPVTWAALAAPALLYAHGLDVLWSRAQGRRFVRDVHVCCFVAGIVSLGVALLPPFDTFADRSLTAHMAQHLVLALVVPALLLLARAETVLLCGVPVRFRRPLNAILVRTRLVADRGPIAPVLATAFFIAAMWTWHVPWLYDAALEHPLVHAAEHACFLVGGFVFLRELIFERRGGFPGRAVLVFLTMLGLNILAALLTFSTRPLYPHYSAGAAAGGLSPLADQRLAGLTMWLPGDVVFLGLVLWLVWRWLEEKPGSPEFGMPVGMHVGASAARAGVDDDRHRCATPAALPCHRINTTVSLE
jgi:putative membrane protein